MLQHTPASMHELISLLANKNVVTVLRQNEEGSIYGITFVDNHNKAVFNGSALGKAYSIAALQTRLFNPAVTTKEGTDVITTKDNTKIAVENTTPLTRRERLQQVPNNIKESQKDNLLQQLITPEPTYENVPMQLLKKNRKRKKKNTNL